MSKMHNGFNQPGSVFLDQNPSDFPHVEFLPDMILALYKYAMFADKKKWSSQQIWIWCIKSYPMISDKAWRFLPGLAWVLERMESKSHHPESSSTHTKDKNAGP